MKEIIDGQTIEYEEGSGNIFADLSIPNPEEALLKSELVAELHRIIRARKLTQAQAGAIVGLTQPKMNNVLNGRLSGYSVERLLRMINRLGYDVEVQVSARGRIDAPGILRVKTA